MTSASDGFSFRVESRKLLARMVDSKIVPSILIVQSIRRIGTSEVDMLMRLEDVLSSWLEFVKLIFLVSIPACSQTLFQRAHP